MHYAPAPGSTRFRGTLQGFNQISSIFCVVSLICTMTTPVTVVIAAIIIAGTMAFIFRYEIEPVSIGVTYKYDRWTGKLQQCAVQKGGIECRDE
jgi:hypothetical protein